MEVQIDNSFIRDVKKSPIHIQGMIPAIIDSIRKAERISDISNLKKLKAAKSTYRIKLENYRLGIYLENKSIILSRCLDGKDVYKHFP